MEAKVSLDELKHNNTFIKNTFKRALFPCMLTILSANINVIVDGILVGQKIGSDALAAINLCMPISLFLCVIGSFFSSGSAINSSKLQGVTKSGKSNEYYKADIYLSYIASVIVTILGIVFLNSICHFLCSNSDAFPYVREYALITIIGAIFKIMLYIPFWYLRLDGKNKEVSYMMALLTIGNIVLDVLFVFVFNLGVFGAGLANVIATALAFGLGMMHLCKPNSSFKFELKLRYNDIHLKSIVFDGAPSAFNNLCSTLRILIINSILLSIGGASLVAIFTAVIGVFSIGECIILGVPQAVVAMLGVYVGEKDNDSCREILRTELIYGGILSAGFVVFSLFISPYVGRIYGLSDNMFIPLLFMSISIFPSLICQAISGYYNISGKNILSITIIGLRLVVMTYIGLIIAIKLNISEFFFFIFAEIATLILIYIITGIYCLKNKNVDRFMLCKMKHEISGQVINFSVENNKEEICHASEKISEFCSLNGLNPKETMRIQLAIEEALVLISDINAKVSEDIAGFDIRAFLTEDIKGVRIRYDGLDFNPFGGSLEGNDYMGIKMISELLETSVYKRTFGVNTLILLLKDKNNE